MKTLAQTLPDIHMVLALERTRVDDNADNADTHHGLLNHVFLLLMNFQLNGLVIDLEILDQMDAIFSHCVVHKITQSV